MLFLFTCLLASCGGQDESAVVAEYGGETLTEKQLQAGLPPGLSPADSVRQAQLLIDDWLTNRVLAEKGQKEVENAESDVEPLVRAYRNELLAQRYLNLVLSQKLDTVVSDAEVDQFYKANPGLFVTPEALVSFFYIKTERPDNTPQLRERLASEKQEDRKIILDWARSDASLFVLDDRFRPVSDLLAYQNDFPGYGLANLPPHSPVIVNASYATNGQKILSFLYIRAVIPAGQPLPLSEVAPRIRELLRNKRRAALIETIQKAALAEAHR